MADTLKVGANPVLPAARNYVSPGFFLVIIPFRPNRPLRDKRQQLRISQYELQKHFAEVENIDSAVQTQASLEHGFAISKAFRSIKLDASGFCAFLGARVRVGTCQDVCLFASVNKRHLLSGATEHELEKPAASFAGAHRLIGFSRGVKIAAGMKMKLRDTAWN
jgi:hypothetical protein